MKIKVNFGIIAVLMCTQAILGIFAGIYLDTGWIKETWLGNDIITLVVVVPILFLCIIIWNRIGKIISIGILGYSIYNYAYYILGAELNKLFLLYVVIISLSIITLIYILSTKNEILSEFDKLIVGKNYIYPAIVFLFIGVGLGAVWIINWANYAFAGKALPQSSSIFRLIASLDLVLMINPLIAGGILLLKKNRQGICIGSIIGVQAFLYLLILCLNSVLISIKYGNFPGELPVWGILIIIEGSGIVMLLLNLNKNIVLTPASTL